MNIEGIELVRVSLPLVAPFETSFGVQTVRDILLVHVIGDEGEGWGECAAHSEPFYNEEFVDGSASVLERWLVPEVFESRGDYQTGASRVKGFPAAKAGLQMAILDADLRCREESLSHYLGGTRDRVPVGVSLGIAPSIGGLVDEVERYLAMGYERIKLKIRPGWDVAPIEAVRTRFGDITLQVDANGSYLHTDLDHLSDMDSLGLVMIEQPFRSTDLETHVQLASRIETPVCLDESIVNCDLAVTALNAGACSVINIKVGRVGGLLEAKAIHDLCVARGIGVWCGGMLESGVGRAANVALASLPGFVFPGDISGSARYFDRDLTDPFIVTDSSIEVSTAAGLGVSVDRDVLADCGARTRRLVADR